MFGVRSAFPAVPMGPVVLPVYSVFPQDIPAEEL